MGKAHLDAFALVARLEECLCPHQSACHVAGIFMNITGNLSRRALRATLHLEGTDIAIELGCEIAKRFAFVHLAGGVQHLTVGALIAHFRPRRISGSDWQNDLELRSVVAV